MNIINCRSHFTCKIYSFIIINSIYQNSNEINNTDEEYYINVLILCVCNIVGTILYGNLTRKKGSSVAHTFMYIIYVNILTKKEKKDKRFLFF